MIRRRRKGVAGGIRTILFILGGAIFMLFAVAFFSQQQPGEVRSRDPIPPQHTSVMPGKPRALRRSVILFNDDSGVVGVFKDVDAIKPTIAFLGTKSARDKALMSALRVDGRSF